MLQDPSSLKHFSSVCIILGQSYGEAFQGACFKIFCAVSHVNCPGGWSRATTTSPRSINHAHMSDPHVREQEPALLSSTRSVKLVFHECFEAFFFPSLLKDDHVQQSHALDAASETQGQDRRESCKDSFCPSRLFLCSTSTLSEQSLGSHLAQYQLSAVWRRESERLRLEGVQEVPEERRPETAEKLQQLGVVWACQTLLLRTISSLIWSFELISELSGERFSRRNSLAPGLCVGVVPTWSQFPTNAQIEVQKSEGACAVTGCKPGHEYTCTYVYYLR